MAIAPTNLTLMQVAKILDTPLVFGSAVNNPSAVENTLVTGLGSLSGANSTQISFLANRKYASELLVSNALAVLLTEQDAAHYAGTALLCKNPYTAFARLSQVFDRTPFSPIGIHPSAQISPSASVSSTAAIGSFVVIEADAVIEDGVIIQPFAKIGQGVHIHANAIIDSHAVIHHRCIIGQRTRIHSGAVIGADGFGFAPDFSATHSQWQRIAQLGRVVIGNDVRVGANSTIDRGALDDTRIEDGVILDNQIQIGHNVVIGHHTVIAASSGIAGSTTVGAHCIFGGFVGIAGHLTIVDKVTLTGGTTVTKSIMQAGSYSSGSAFSETAHWRKTAVIARQLPDLALHKLPSQINDLQKRLEQLELQLQILTATIPDPLKS